VSKPPTCLPPRPPRYAPRQRLPRGATDCHSHVFELSPRYPLTRQRSYTPVAASLDDYLRMCEVVGIERTVQVSASVYGFDNSLTLDVIAQLGQHRARGVAGVPPDVSAAELERLHAGGFRGARLSTHIKGYGGSEAIAALAPRFRPLGWHVQLHVDHVGELAELEDRLLRTEVAMVFDHLGCARGEDTVGHPGFQALLRILRQRDDRWVKLSSWYRRSQAGPPDYADMRPLVQALVAARPDRVVWGSNWPHSALFARSAMPEDERLVDLFCEWVPEPRTREQILVTNPARLYGFDG
jgi:2-pyrone-4,6-dicarboxylate lactonase